MICGQRWAWSLAWKRLIKSSGPEPACQVCNEKYAFDELQLERVEILKLMVIECKIQKGVKI